MKKIIVVTPRFPYPVVGGDKLRIFNICKEISKKHSLTLVSLVENKKDLCWEGKSDDVFDAIHCVYMPKIQSLVQVALEFCLGRLPLQVAYYSSRKMKKIMEEELPKNDVAICHLVRTSEYIREFEGMKILEMTDAISMNYERVKRKKGRKTFREYIYGAEFERLLNYELKVVDLMDHTYLVSDFDKKYLEEKSEVLPSHKISVCGNGVEFEKIKFNYEPDSKTIIFIGNMESAQNIDAVNFFIKDVFPYILESVPDARFKILGKIKNNSWQNEKSVDVIGCFDSLNEVAAGASVGVCPMRIGAGVQNKILEYMSLGVPSVVSELGAEGLHARDGEELYITSNPNKMAECIIKILNNPSSHRVMSQKARCYVENQHSWSKCLESFSLILD